MEAKIDKLLMEDKNCVIVYSNGDKRTDIVSDYLALEFLSKEEIIKSMDEGEEYIFPNVMAVNVLENFDELRIDLNRILNNSKWANESCIIIMNVEKENIELLKNFSAYHNVSMVLISEDEKIVVPQLNYSIIDTDYIFSNVKNDEEFAHSIVELAEAVNLMNESYKEILEVMDMIIDF